MNVESYRMKNAGTDTDALAKFEAKHRKSWLKSHPGDVEGAEKFAHLMVTSYGHHFRKWERVEATEPVKTYWSETLGRRVTVPE